MPLLVNEIFYSIQGESLNNGRPCVFVRLTGCNLRCRYCDTTYAYEEGKSMSIPDIMQRVASFQCNLVEITGGEPLLQPEASSLMEHFLNAGYEVMLETNGSFDISMVPARCMKIVDMKCPSSGESHNNDYENMRRLSPQDQIKFVIGNREDYEFAKSAIDNETPAVPMHHVLFSAVADELPQSALADWILADNLQVRFHMQLHKTLWPNIIRGK
jgi:7-carboxy-7-deazaguanine synthase